MAVLDYWFLYTKRSSMKIATWNLERLKHKACLAEIESVLRSIAADILVLTETDSRVRLENYKYCFSTPPVVEIAPAYYEKTENRVSIYTNYEPIDQLKTHDPYTNLCMNLKTGFGLLAVYGTIIGIYGNRNKNFAEDLLKQVSDFSNLSKDRLFCVLGDYNITFSDDYYFTKLGRAKLTESFLSNNLLLLTGHRKECTDHITVSKNFADRFTIDVYEWNEDKKLSDHKGIVVELEPITDERMIECNA